MPRIVDLGVTGYWWLSGVSSLTTPSAPKVTDLSTAKNISPYVVTTTSINPTASDTVNERAVTDVSNAVVPTVGNYEGNLVLFRDFTSNEPSENDLAATFTKGTFGWILRRLGKPHTTNLATGDEVDVFLFMCDAPQKSGGQGDGYLKLTVPLLQQGQFYLDTTIVSGGA